MTTDFSLMGLIGGRLGAYYGAQTGRQPRTGAIPCPLISSLLRWSKKKKMLNLISVWSFPLCGGFINFLFCLVKVRRPVASLWGCFSKGEEDKHEKTMNCHHCRSTNGGNGGDEFFNGETCRKRRLQVRKEVPALLMRVSRGQIE